MNYILNPTEEVFYYIVFVGFPAVILVVAYFWTRGSGQRRIERDIRNKGGKLISIFYDPYADGLFTRDGEIYQVQYKDAWGNTHKAQCKTSFFTGVYYKNDEVLELGPREQQKIDRLSELADENRRLSEELERLKKA